MHSAEEDPGQSTAEQGARAFLFAPGSVPWTDEDTALLIAESRQVSVELSVRQAQQLALLCQVVAGATVNVSGLRTVPEIRRKHLVDSLACLPVAALGRGERVLDLGTGAGFPGLVAAIACPDLDLTLLDAAKKKTEFVVGAAASIGLAVHVVQGRAEELARDQAWRQSFDCVLARAVAPLPALLEYGLPLVRQGGRLIALKGPGVDAELAAAGRALRLLGGEVEVDQRVELPGGAGVRRILRIRQKANVPVTYPRRAAAIGRRPL